MEKALENTNITDLKNLIGQVMLDYRRQATNLKKEKKILRQGKGRSD